MKVIAINGSPKAKGNTYSALNLVSEGLKKENIETEIIHVGHLELKGCVACGRCSDGHCQYSDETFREIVEKVYAADGLLLGSPVYYSAISGNMKCFLDRLFFPNRGRLRHKIASSIAVLRRSGGVATFDQLNHYFLISEMLIAPSFYWNVIHGGSPGEVLQDGEGVALLKNMAQNMAWMLKMKEYSKDAVPAPEALEKVRTNFIR